MKNGRTYQWFVNHQMCTLHKPDDTLSWKSKGRIQMGCQSKSVADNKEGTSIN